MAVRVTDGPKDDPHLPGCLWFPGQSLPQLGLLLSTICINCLLLMKPTSTDVVTEKEIILFLFSQIYGSKKTISPKISPGKLKWEWDCITFGVFHEGDPFSHCQGSRCSLPLLGHGHLSYFSIFRTCRKPTHISLPLTSHLIVCTQGPLYLG